MRLAGEIFQDGARLISAGEDPRPEVTDEGGMLLFRLDVSIIEPAAIRTVRRADRDRAPMLRRDPRRPR